MTLYNEFDPKAAAWLRELVTQGHLPAGTVDERSIEDLEFHDIPDTFHAFAGIGGWPYALALAGWDAAEPVWTGSCPCQPFSAAGKQGGVEDERHLWPAWFRLIAELRPHTIFGEQVAGSVGFGWLDGVFADLEGEGYRCGAVVLGAHSVGAPHIRQRLFWVADAAQRGQREHERDAGTVAGAEQGGAGQEPEAGRSAQAAGNRGEAGGLGDPHEPGWSPVVFSSDCDEWGNCPRCGADYAECACPGPTEDGVEYVEIAGVVYGRRLPEFIRAFMETR